MRLKELPIPGCFEIELDPFLDKRGTFYKAFDKNKFREFGIDLELKQVNLSNNIQKGTIRGLHVQTKPYNEFKLVQCLSGSVFDVVVDLRKKSPFFGTWCKIELLPLKNAVLVAPGVAHGYQTLAPHTSLLYLHTQTYIPEHARGIRFDDEELGIAWPLAPNNVSTADLELPTIFESEFSL